MELGKVQPRLSQHTAHLLNVSIDKDTHKLRQQTTCGCMDRSAAMICSTASGATYRGDLGIEDEPQQIRPSRHRHLCVLHIRNAANLDLSHPSPVTRHPSPVTRHPTRAASS